MPSHTQLAEPYRRVGYTVVLFFPDDNAAPIPGYTAATLESAVNRLDALGSRSGGSLHTALPNQGASEHGMEADPRRTAGCANPAVPRMG